MSQFKYVYFNLSENVQLGLLGDDDISKKDFLRKLFSQKTTFTYMNSTYAYRPHTTFNSITATDGVEEHEFIVARLGKETNAEVTELDDDEFYTYSITDWKASWFILCTSANKQTAAVERLTNVNLRNLCEQLQIELINKANQESASWTDRFLVDVEFVRDLGKFWEYVEAHRSEISRIAFSFLKPNRDLDGSAGEFKKILGEWHKETPVEEHEVSLKLASNLTSADGSITNQFVELVEDGAANVSLYNQSNRKLYDARKNQSDAPSKIATIDEEATKRALTNPNSLRSMIRDLFLPLRRDNQRQ